MKQAPMTLQRKSQTGFGMMEVLIALLVLSFGLLGLAGLQMTGLKGSHTASLRSKATLIAYEMAERMRLNLAGINLGAYSAVDTNATPADPGCLSIGCGAQDMAKSDVRAISQYFNNVESVSDFVSELPDGRLLVAPNGATIYTITVSWTEMLDDGPATQQFLMEFQP